MLNLTKNIDNNLILEKKEIYNDYQIMTPFMMEKIAKAYNDKLNLINNKENINKAKQLIFFNLKNIIYNLQNLKNFCTIKFYNNKKNDIFNIIQNLNTALKKLNYTETVNVRMSNKNYCQIVKTCLQELSESLNYSLELPNENKIEIHNILTSNIIHLSNLIGECKYRDS